MKTMTVDTLTQRLDRLERESRRWKLAACLSVLGMVAVALIGQAAPRYRIVEAEKFVLRDSAGRVRATLGAQSSGPYRPTTQWDSSSTASSGIRTSTRSSRRRSTGSGRRRHGRGGLVPAETAFVSLSADVLTVRLSADVVPVRLSAPEPLLVVLEAA
jgi:hypothetical protein